MDAAANEPEPATPPGATPPAWARLAGGLGVATDARKLILAALGVGLLLIGWSALDRAFRVPRFGPFAGPAPLAAMDLRRASDPVLVPMRPFLALFAIGQGTPAFVHALLAAIWAAAVWGIVGGAIARVAVVQLATGERVGVLTALRFALGRAVTLVGSPLSPFVGIVLLALPCALMGLLLYRIPGPIGVTIAGALAFLPLLIGVVMALILLGLAAGWPLMIATVAADGEDGFDALSRSYAYVFQRPVRFAFYAAVAGAFGLLGYAFAIGFGLASIRLAVWALALGGPDDRVFALFSGVAPAGDAPATLHSAWLWLAGAIAHGWAYAYFWTASAQIYLLLRRDVDGTPLHDIYQPEHEADPFAPETEPIPATPVTPEVPAPSEAAASEG